MNEIIDMKSFKSFSDFKAFKMNNIKYGIRYPYTDNLGDYIKILAEMQYIPRIDIKVKKFDEDFDKNNTNIKFVSDLNIRKEHLIMSLKKHTFFTEEKKSIIVIDDNITSSEYSKFSFFENLFKDNLKYRSQFTTGNEDEKLKKANDLLIDIANSKIVITPKLESALSAIAFEIPLIFTNFYYQKDNFDLISMYKNIFKLDQTWDDVLYNNPFICNWFKQTEKEVNKIEKYINMIEIEPSINSIYKHYKNEKIYKVLDIGIMADNSSNNGQKMIIYSCIDDPKKIYIRSIKEFMESVIQDGKIIKRFINQ